MTIITKEDRTRKNKLIGQAHRLGLAIEFWSFIEEVSKEIRDYSAAKISKNQIKQDSMLDEIESIRKGCVELIEVVKEN